jgi:hypothetical protein
MSHSPRNAAYVAGGPDVVHQLRETLPSADAPRTTLATGRSSPISGTHHEFAEPYRRCQYVRKLRHDASPSRQMNSTRSMLDLVLQHRLPLALSRFI